MQELSRSNTEFQLLYIVIHKHQLICIIHSKTRAVTQVMNAPEKVS
jgi:hypothetical protein